jgi:hypothetical protein
VLLRLPDSTTLRRRFHKTKKISDITNFVKTKYKEHFQLIVNIPRKVYNNESATLEEEGFYPRFTLIVQKI